MDEKKADMPFLQGPDNVPGETRTAYREDLVEKAGAVSIASGMFGVLAAPAETFCKIAEKPSWRFMAPLVILMILSTLGGVCYTQRANLPEAIQHEMRNNPRAAQMSEAQMDNVVNMQAEIIEILAYTASAVVGIKYIIVALALWLLVLLFGDQISFGNIFRVVAWSQLPQILLAIVFLVVIIVRDPTYMSMRNPLPTNLGAVFGEDRLGRPMYALLSSLDIITIWMLWLYTRGLAAFTKAKAGKMAAIVFGLFAVIVLFHFGIAMVF